MPGKQVTELDALPSFTDTSLLPVHNGAGLKKGLLSQLANYLGTKFSNPNLLLNPDFKVNQRGLTTYNETDYSFDRWKIYNTTVKRLDNGISYKGGSTTTNSLGTLENYISQILDNELNEEFTISVKVSSIVGSFRLEAMKKGGDTLHGKDDLIGKKDITTNGIHTLTLDGSSAPLSIIRFGTTSQNGTCTIEWFKLEKGKHATAFVRPIYSEEYVKCMWYFIPLLGVRSGYVSNGIIYLNVPEVNSMRTSKPSADTSKMNLKGWIYTATGTVITVNTSDIISAFVDDYKELQLTPSSGLKSQLTSLGITTISYAIAPGGGIYLDAEIYDDE
mgnify:CR=1 FL=1